MPLAFDAMILVCKGKDKEVDLCVEFLKLADWLDVVGQRNGESLSLNEKSVDIKL